MASLRKRNLLLVSLNIMAQSTAMLTGTVVDPTGSVVPGAQVTCRNVSTDLKFTTAFHGNE
jgi:hypothetical protein